MFLSIPTLLILGLIAVVAFYLGHKFLPSILEHDHDAVIRLLTRMDNVYAKIVADKAKLDSQRVSILSKIQNAIKPAAAATAPAAAPTDAAPKA